MALKCQFNRSVKILPMQTPLTPQREKYLLLTLAARSQTAAHAALAADMGTCLVIGTTGLDMTGARPL